MLRHRRPNSARHAHAPPMHQFSAFCDHLLRPSRPSAAGSRCTPPDWRNPPPSMLFSACGGRRRQVAHLCTALMSYECHWKTLASRSRYMAGLQRSDSCRSGCATCLPHESSVINELEACEGEWSCVPCKVEPKFRGTIATCTHPQDGALRPVGALACRLAGLHVHLAAH
jgi:hypothetical protein